MIRDIQKVDDDIIEAKRLIKQKLYSDPDIIEALHNVDLNPEEPDSYIDVNIFDYIRIPGTTDTVKNFICFDIRQDSMSERNDHFKNQLYIFQVSAYEDDIRTSYGMARHDLLAYLIRDIFNYSNMFGLQLVLTSNVPGLMDSSWSSRTLTFKAVTPNSLNRAVKTNKHEFVGSGPINGND